MGGGGRGGFGSAGAGFFSTVFAFISVSSVSSFGLREFRFVNKEGLSAVI